MLETMVRYFVILMAIAAVPATAVEPAILSPDQRTAIGRIEDYLNNVTTLEARFVQIAEDGMAEGQIYLSRPGKMRVEYDPPVPILMVASPPWVMYYDSKLNQTSFVLTSRTPATFFLRENISLNDGITITNFERTRGAVRLSMITEDNPDAGSITIVLEYQPIRLVKWIVVDAQGKRIETALLNPRFGVTLDEKLFSIVDPSRTKDED
jgi:outer membrane lipoprotein-sorting protein